MRKFVDLTGRQFGRLTVINSAGKSANNSYLFECLCLSHLQRGEVSSCGCFQQENRLANKAGLKHGQCYSATYGSWAAMKARCEYTKHPAFADYGGRGITVCERWRESFEAFLEDMGERPEGMTLDRFPDKDGNYEQGNCRWATLKQQMRNRRCNRVLTCNGISATLSEWAETTGIGLTTIRERLKRGWSTERALQT